MKPSFKTRNQGSTKLRICPGYSRRLGVFRKSPARIRRRADTHGVPAIDVSAPHVKDEPFDIARAEEADLRGIIALLAAMPVTVARNAEGPPCGGPSPSEPRPVRPRSQVA